MDLPLATIQFDLDGTHALAEHYGVRLHEQRDYLLEQAIPQALELCRSVGITATFFIIAKTLAAPQIRQALESLILTGHEPANHSLTHPLNFARLTPQHLQSEVSSAHTIITRVTGQEPIGFKAPNYELTSALWRLLENLDYRYDCSLFPTSIGSALKIIQAFRANRRVLLSGYASTSKLPPGITSPESRRRVDRQQQFRGASHRLRELPITVSPLWRLRLPLHSSFLLTIPHPLAQYYLRKSLAQLSHENQVLNFAIHAWELCEIPGSSPLYHYFQGFGSQATRLSRLTEYLKLITEKFRVEPTGKLVSQLRDTALQPVTRVNQRIDI